MENTDILTVDKVTKRYAKHTALEEVSLNMPKGSIFGLLGPNGAGKTSLIRIITQITAADEGKVLFNGRTLQREDIARIGYLPEERGLYKKMKVGEQLIYLARLKGLSMHDAKKRIKFWLEKFDMTTWWNKAIEDLSKGMQQKVQFIATIIHQPELLILDEPFSGFDPINTNLIKDEIMRLRNEGCSIIFSTHRMESVEELCDYIALINQSKKVLEGKTREIKENYKEGIYFVETDKEIASGGEDFSVLSAKESGDGTVQHKVKIHNGSLNDFVSKVVSQVSICALREEVPSVNEIFIRTVGETNGASL